MKKLTDIVLVKQTGHGFHVMGYFPNRTTQENMDMRRMLGDCSGRVELDTSRVEYHQEDVTETLFSEKKINGVVTGEIDYNILSLPFWGNGEKWCKTNGSKNS